MTQACFHLLGKVPLRIDVLIIHVNGATKDWPLSFMISELIPSKPQDLLFFSFLIILKTSLSDTVLILKCKLRSFTFSLSFCHLTTFLNQFIIVHCPAYSDFGCPMVPALRVGFQSSHQFGQRLSPHSSTSNLPTGWQIQA